VTPIHRRQASNSARPWVSVVDQCSLRHSSRIHPKFGFHRAAANGCLNVAPGARVSGKYEPITDDAIEG
jgi:hypothetical protein